MTPETPPGWRTLETPHVLLQVPASWRRLDPDERTGPAGILRRADAVLVLEDVPEHRFRPNVVVTSEPSTEPIEALSARLLQEIAAMRDPARALSCDLWPHAEQPARRHEFFYVADDVAVLVTTLVLAADGHRVDVTVSRALEDAALLQDSVSWLHLSVRPPLGALR